MPIGEEWVHVPGKSLSAFLIWYHRFQIKLWKCLPLFLCTGIISFISILSQNVFLLHRNFSHSIDCIRHMCVGVESQWRNPLSLWHFPEKSHRRLLEKSPRCLLSNIRYFTIFKSLDNSTGNQLLVIHCKLQLLTYLILFTMYSNIQIKIYSEWLGSDVGGEQRGTTLQKIHQVFKEGQ